MTPTEILKSEHRVIEQVLDCLEKMAAGCEQTGALEEEHARAAVDFLRSFADGCHHNKEENQLFPMAEQRGVLREQGPIGQMVYEHEQGREVVRAMEEAIDGAARGDEEGVQRFTSNARSYIQLLRDHINKEDQCLFPMADSLMSDSDRESLLAAFEKTEKEDMGEGTHSRFLKIANDLADHYGVAKVEPTGGGCCGH